MTKIADIMTPNPISLSQFANVNKARMLMAEKKIRHIPVVELDTGKIIGMLSQKAVMVNAIKIINQRGIAQLEHTEKSLSIESIMNENPAIFSINNPLNDVGKHLIEKRCGCVAIEKDGLLAGVVTSNDFVKLAVRLLL